MRNTADREPDERRADEAEVLVVVERRQRARRGSARRPSSCRARGCTAPTRPSCARSRSLHDDRLDVRGVELVGITEVPPLDVVLVAVGAAVADRDVAGGLDSATVGKAASAVRTSSMRPCAMARWAGVTRGSSSEMIGPVGGSSGSGIRVRVRRILGIRVRVRVRRPVGGRRVSVRSVGRRGWCSCGAVVVGAVVAVARRVGLRARVVRMRPPLRLVVRVIVLGGVASSWACPASPSSWAPPSSPSACSWPAVSRCEWSSSSWRAPRERGQRRQQCERGERSRPPRARPRRAPPVGHDAQHPNTAQRGERRRGEVLQADVLHLGEGSDELDPTVRERAHTRSAPPLTTSVSASRSSVGMDATATAQPIWAPPQRPNIHMRVRSPGGCRRQPRGSGPPRADPTTASGRAGRVPRRKVQAPRRQCSCGLPP